MKSFTKLVGVAALAVGFCAGVVACGGSSSTSAQCAVLPLGMQVATGSGAAQTAQASTSCDAFLVVEGVRSAGTARPNSYLVTIRNDATADVDLSTVDLQGSFSGSSSTDASATTCNATLSGVLKAGRTTDVPLGCARGPAATDAYLVLRLEDRTMSFRIPEPQ